jgi:hypothetical protein
MLNRGRAILANHFRLNFLLSPLKLEIMNKAVRTVFLSATLFFLMVEWVE